MVANNGWTACPVKAVSRQRRGPKARLYRVCRPAKLGRQVDRGNSLAPCSMAISNRLFLAHLTPLLTSSAQAAVYRELIVMLAARYRLPAVYASVSRSSTLMTYIARCGLGRRAVGCPIAFMLSAPRPGAARCRRQICKILSAWGRGLGTPPVSGSCLRRPT